MTGTPSAGVSKPGFRVWGKATGSTVDEVKTKAMAHAQIVHADILKTMSSPAQMAAMEKQMESVIK